MTKNQSPRGLETSAVSAFDDAYSTGGHPSRRARLRESGEYVEPVVELTDSQVESSADEFAPTVDDIRSGRFPATTALSIVPPARGFASEESLPGSLEAGSSAANATAVAGAHLPGSRRIAPATAESVEKAQEEKTLTEKAKPSASGVPADSASAKSAPVKKAPAKGKQPSLAKSGSLASLCVMYGAGIAFVTTMVVSNGIGAEGSGEFFRLMALFAIAISLVTFGADTGLVRTMSAQRALGRYGVLPQLIRYGLIPSLVTSVLLVTGVYIYTGIVPMAPEYQAAMRVSSAFVLVAALMTVFFGALRGLHRVVTFTLLQNVLLPTLRFAAVGLVVLFSGQLMDLVYAWTIPVAITAVVALWLLERAFPSEEHLEVLPSEDSPTETFRSFWGFSSARGVATVVETILEWIDVLVVTAFLGAAAGGVYVNRCVRVGAMIEHTGRVVTGPSISAALATRQLDRAREIFLSTTRVLTALSWPFYLSLAFFGPVLLGFFGKGFEAGAGILWVICPAAMLSMSAGGVQSVLLMSGKSRWQLLNKLSSLVVAVTLNFTLVPVWGLYGAVTAWASALLIDTFLASYQVFRLVGIRASVREMAPSLFLGAAVPTACALVSLTFLGQSVLGVIVYVVLLVPVYGAVLYRFRKALGIERFLSARRAKS